MFQMNRKVDFKYKNSEFLKKTINIKLKSKRYKLNHLNVNIK